MVSTRVFRSADPVRSLLVASLVTAAAAVPLCAQGSQAGKGMRVGVSFGGISTFGVTAEYFDGNESLDLTVGTWSFRDLSVAVVARHYFGGGEALPFVGGGLWLVTAWPEDGRTGFATVLHAPVGVDLQPGRRHAVGLALNVNRALWVRRTDPDDDLPLNRRLVPLPGV
jgi:hypothetical protein